MAGEHKVRHSDFIACVVWHEVLIASVIRPSQPSPVAKATPSPARRERETPQSTAFFCFLPSPAVRERGRGRGLCNGGTQMARATLKLEHQRLEPTPYPRAIAFIGNAFYTAS